MIDKAELRVPHFTPFTGRFSRLYRELRHDSKGPFHPSLHYETVGDLRRFGHPVILHIDNVHDRVGNHKLELIETGTMTYSQMRHEVERIFALRTTRDQLDVMRVDLAVDVVGISVGWFVRNIRVRYKRWEADMLTSERRKGLEVAVMGRKGIETAYFGKRPNCIRIYNKIAERQHQYRRMIAAAKRVQLPVSDLPTFEQKFGHAETGLILTRVERVIAAGRVPPQISTLQNLRHAIEFDPFESLVFGSAGKPEPKPDDYTVAEYLMGVGIRYLIEQDGIHRTRQFLNRERNARRFVRRYAEFLPSDASLLSRTELLEAFRQSVSKQLAA